MLPFFIVPPLRPQRDSIPYSVVLVVFVVQSYTTITTMFVEWENGLSVQEQRARSV